MEIRSEYGGNQHGEEMEPEENLEDLEKRDRKYMCIEMRCMYVVVNYELCNHTIVRPFKGDRYCDGIHCGNPTS